MTGDQCTQINAVFEINKKNNNGEKFKQEKIFGLTKKI